jgi:hypothetical protein
LTFARFDEGSADGCWRTGEEIDADGVILEFVRFGTPIRVARSIRRA